MVAHDSSPATGPEIEEFQLLRFACQRAGGWTIIAKCSENPKCAADERWQTALGCRTPEA